MPSTVGYPKDNSALSSDAAAEAVRRATQQLALGKEFRQTNREQVWKRSEKQYEGKHWEIANADDPTSDLITINISFSTVNTIVPYITGEEPNFLVEPYSGDADPRMARIQAALLNRVWRSSQTHGQEKLEDAAVDLLIYGDGYMQVGHIVEDKRLGDGEHVQCAKIVLDRIDPWDVWIDPTSDGFHNARWVCRRIVTTIEELEEDDRYHVPEELSLGAGIEFFIEDDKLRERMFERGEGDETLRWVVLYEFYDLVRNYSITFADGSEYPLRWIEDCELPIVQFSNYRIPRSPYHMGELEQIWEMQLELNKTRSQMITHRRRNVQKFAYNEDLMTPEGLNALTSPIVNEGVPVRGGDLPISEIIFPLSAPNLSADVYNVSDLVTRDVYEISGVNEYLRGATPEIRRTATEATIIEGASNVKSRYKLRLIEKGLRRVGTLMLAVMADVFPQTEYDELGLYLTGSDAQAISRMEHGAQLGQMMDEGAPEEELAAFAERANSGVYSDLVVTPTDQLFQGTYEVFVESHSTELRNPIMREQRAREMFITMMQAAPVLQQMGVPVNLRRFLELWLEAAGIDDIGGLLQGGQNPMAAIQAAMAAQGQGGAPPAEGPTGVPAGPQGDPTAILNAMGVLGAENTGAMPAAS